MTDTRVLGETIVLDDIGPPRRGRSYPVAGSASFLLLPAGTLLCGLVLVPVLRTLHVSVTDVETGRFVKLDHFRTALAAPGAGAVVWRTLLWALVVPAVVTVLGYLLASVSRRSQQGALVRLILVAPIAIPLAVTGVIFRLMYDPDPDRGLATWIATHLLHRASDTAPQFLGPGLVTVSLMSAFVWAWVGLAVLVFRAALDAIPPDLVDAVRAHGGSRLDVFVDTRWRPLLRRTVAVVFALVALGTSRTFDLILIMVPGSMRDEASVLALRVWQTSGGSTSGPGAALGVLWLGAVAVGMLAAAFGIRQAWPPPGRSGPPTVAARPTRSRKLAELVAAGATIAWLIPVGLLVATSLHSPIDAATRGWWAAPVRLKSYRELIGSAELHRALGFTLALAIVVTLAVLAIALLAAYPLAWLSEPAAQATGLLLMAALIVPVQVIAGPVNEVLGRIWSCRLHPWPRAGARRPGRAVRRARPPQRLRRPPGRSGPAGPGGRSPLVEHDLATHPAQRPGDRRGLRAGIRPGLERSGGRTAVQRSGRGTAGVAPLRAVPPVRVQQRSARGQLGDHLDPAGTTGGTDPPPSDHRPGLRRDQMTTDDTANDRSHRRARWRMRALAGSAIVIPFIVEVGKDTMSELARQVLGPAAVVLAVVCGIVWGAFEWHSHRAERRSAADPADTLHAPAPGGPTLPYPAGFTGRAAQVAAIVDMLRVEHAVAVVGRRAVGTSSCAVQAANLRRDDFPDGQFYLDLRDGGRPQSPRTVLASLAHIMGTAAPRSARWDDLAEAAHLLNGVLDGKRILLVLDNVDEPAQVRALLPPTARTCRLLMAGAPALAYLDGVTPYWLGEPDLADAVEIFAAAGQTSAGVRARRPDPRTDPAVREIVELCGRQPRTIRALGYRMARHGWRSTDLLAGLRRAVAVAPHQRVPSDPAVALLTERDTAYTALSAGAKRLYRLMSLGPVALDRTTIAALGPWRPERSATLLDELATGGFVVGASSDRYEIPPLLAVYARLHLRRAEPIWRRIAAQARLVRHLARQAERHVLNLTVTGVNPGREVMLPFDDDPAGWFELHQYLLLAVLKDAAGAVKPLPRQVRRWWFRLAVALCGWCAHEGRLAEWAEVCQVVLDSPTANGRPKITGWAHNELGALRRRQHDPRSAADALMDAVAERGRRGTAQARMNLGLVLLDLGNLDDAVETLELSRRHRARADRSGHALTDLALGVAHLARDKPETAQHHLVKAANSFRSIGEARGYAAALTNLVLVYARLGEHLDAAQTWRAALREYDEVADLTARAAALLNAGATLVTSAPERAEQAYELLSDSRRLREQWQPDRRARPDPLYLGDAAELLGRPDEARQHWVDAAGICEAVRDPDGAAAADARLLR